jgi:tetratricopeptide (TPR) repeat protein
MLTPVLSKSDQKDPFLAAGKNENVQRFPDFKDHGMLQLSADYKEPIEFLAARRTKIIHQLNPSQNARAVVELGDIHLAKKELKAAKNAYKDAIRKDPYLVEAYKKLIPLLLISRDLRAANNYYLRLLDLTNNHPDVVHDYLLFRLTFFSSDSGELEQIQTRLRELIKTQSNKTALRNTLGIVLLVYESNPSGAKAIFQKVLDEDPQNVDALNNIGICFQHMKQYSKASDYYGKAIAINPNYSAAYENIASNYITQDKPDKALKVLLEGRDLGLQYTPVWDHNTGWLMLLTGKLPEAKSWYLKKTKEEPGNNLLFNNLGVCYENLGDLEAAKKHYLRAVELCLAIKKSQPDHKDPRALYAFNNLCRLLQKSADFPMLEAVAKHLLDLNPDNPVGLYYLGSARIQLKKYVAARQALEKSILIEGGVAIPYIDLGFLLECIFHDYTEAINVLEAAVTRNLRHEYIVNNLAFAYTKNGNITQAEQLLKFKEKYPNTTATRGLIEFYKGNFETGNRFYAKALEGVVEDKKDEATQIWHYEQAAFWFRKEQVSRAKEYLEKAKALGKDSYIYNDILQMELEIKKTLQAK